MKASSRFQIGDPVVVKAHVRDPDLSTDIYSQRPADRQWYNECRWYRPSGQAKERGDDNSRC
jgi:hypothetical protein